MPTCSCFNTWPTPPGAPSKTRGRAPPQASVGYRHGRSFGDREHHPRSVGPPRRGRHVALYVVARFCPLDLSFFFASPSLRTRGTSRTSSWSALRISSERSPKLLFFTRATTSSSVLPMSAGERRARRRPPLPLLGLPVLVPPPWGRMPVPSPPLRARRPLPSR